jgi:hypothetical protein
MEIRILESQEKIVADKEEPMFRKDIFKQYQTKSDFRIYKDLEKASIKIIMKAKTDATPSIM